MPDHAYALRDDLQAQDIQLDQLFLDPNNPRFAGSGWQDVPEDRIVLESTQSEVLQRLLDDFEVSKLRANMEINGFLPIDRIVVRQLSGDAYVVLEGNRRVCAAKELRRVAARAPAIPSEISRTVATIPCLLYTGEDPHAAWTFQGLRHITGLKDWPAFNKAKLLVTQMENEGLTLTEVGQRFGLTPHGAGQWARGYNAFTQACEESDYTEELDDRAYTYFQELFSRT